MEIALAPQRTEEIKANEDILSENIKAYLNVCDDANQKPNSKDYHMVIINHKK